MATGLFRAAGDTVKVSPTRIRRSRRGSINIVLSLGFPSPLTALLAHSPRKSEIFNGDACLAALLATVLAQQCGIRPVDTLDNRKPVRYMGRASANL